jgi:two-component system, OmpR family, sensor histidine kinase NblS
LGQLAESREILLKIMPVPKTWIAFGDYEMILRVLINLLGNAIKFTPAKGHITLLVEKYGEQPGRRSSTVPSLQSDSGQIKAGEPFASFPSAAAEERFWRIGVQDTGIGIHEEELESIFEKFVQSRRPAAHKNSGTGLGLSICKGIIEAHRGRVWVESPGLGLGSTFYFTLPVYQEKGTMVK